MAIYDINSFLCIIVDIVCIIICLLICIFVSAKSVKENKSYNLL